MNKMSSTVLRNSEEESSLNNGIINGQSDWSRCNSFSSSSNDSAVFCTSHLQRPIFPSRKRLTNEENSKHISKRSRNSSGSSASSNVSCVSEKNNKSKSLITPNSSVSSINNTKTRNMEKFENLSNFSSLTLQHETLLNNRLPHSISMDTVLPFRHNLRRNIRKKTCSCDCTSTCTTVVVSRQYKGIGAQTVEEKTVISQTKVKRFVERKPAQVSHADKTETSNSHDPGNENGSPKNESNRKRRSEIEKLYDSLHEIKWAKNFSPDNILRQFDVRQAASCSVFGRPSENKPAEKPKTPKKEKFSFNNQGSETMSPKTPRNARQNKTFIKRHISSYITRSKQNSSTKNSSFMKKIENSTPPVLEKNNFERNDLLNNDSVNYSHHPILSKEMFTPEKDICNSNGTLNKNNFEVCDFNSIERNCSSYVNDNFSKKLLSFDLKSQSVSNNIENLNDCTATFFDIAEEEIRTIDACFREVGAEVVVTTCYDTDYKLPLLTSVEEIQSSVEMAITNESPPVLEPLPKELCFEELPALTFYDGACHNDTVSSELNSTPTMNLPCSSDSPYKTFFPRIDPDTVPEEYYSPPLLFFNEADPYAGIMKDFPINNCYETKFGLPCLLKSEDLHLLEQNPVLDQDPPVLEPCLNISKENFSSNNETDVQFDERCYKSEIQNVILKPNTKVNFVNKRTNKVVNFKELEQFRNKVIARLLTKSLTIRTGRRIFNKYLRLSYCNSRKLCLPSSDKKNSFEIKKIDNHMNKFFNNSGNFNQSLLMNGRIPTIISSELSISQCKLEPSEKINTSILTLNSSIRKHESVVSSEQCISNTLESCHKTSDSVLETNDITVIRTFNRKLSITESPSKVAINQVNNSMCFRSSKDSDLSIKPSKKLRKSPPLNYMNNQCIENQSDISGYTKILSEAKKKENKDTELVKIPPRVFTCHYQTINVTHGNNYIQIVLKINRGKSIFLTHESLIELKEAITKAGNDNDCRLLILNGFGQTFCLGLDLRPLIGTRKNQAVGEIANAVKDLISTLAGFHKPLVAIVNGAAYGLGLTLLNHADVTLATDNASFCMPYSKLGYMPEGGATLTLPQTVGTTIAMDLILRGQVITAQQARDIGLVNEVVEVHRLPQDLVSRVKTMAENSISAMETTKAMIKMRFHIQLPLVLETETRLLPQMWLSPSCQEAIQSALDSGFLADC